MSVKFLSVGFLLRLCFGMVAPVVRYLYTLDNCGHSFWTLSHDDLVAYGIFALPDMMSDTVTSPTLELQVSFMKLQMEQLADVHCTGWPLHIGQENSAAKIPSSLLCRRPAPRRWNLFSSEYHSDDDVHNGHHNHDHRVDEAHTYYLIFVTD